MNPRLISFVLVLIITAWTHAFAGKGRQGNGTGAAVEFGMVEGSRDAVELDGVKEWRPGESDSELFGPDNWVKRFSTGTHLDVAVGAGLTVAVGASGQIFTSPNGLTHWTLQETNTRELLKDIIWDGSQFLATGTSGILLTSQDGRTWIMRTTGTTDDLEAIAWSGDTYVIAGKDGRLLVSNDGVSWSQSTTGHGFTVLDLIYDNGRFLGVGEDGGIIESADGVLWSRQFIDSDAPFSRVYKTATGYMVYANYVVIVPVGPSLSSLEIYRSSDGVTWEETDEDPTETFPDAIWNGQVWVSIKNNNLVVSEDRQNWRVDPLKPVFNTVASNSSVFVGAGYESIYASSDGESWTKVFDPESEIFAVAWNGAVFMAVGENGLFYRSSNGQDWVSSSISSEARLFGLAWSGSLWVAVGERDDQGMVYTSSNGVSWSGRAIPGSPGLNSVAWNGYRFAAVGLSGSVIYSDDGTQWSAADSKLDHDLRAVAWNGKKFGAVGTDGVVLVSSDAETWRVRETESLDLTGLIAGSWGFLAVGAYGDTVYSADGSRWVTFPNEFDSHLNAVTFNGDIFVAVSGDGGVFSSNPILLNGDR